MELVGNEPTLEALHPGADAVGRAIDIVLDLHKALDRPGRKSDALHAVIQAVSEYENAEMWEGNSPGRLMRLLSRIESKPETASKEIADADPAIGAPALAQIWQVALRRGSVKVEAHGERRVTLALTEGRWAPADGHADEWLDLLASDRRSLRAISREALNGISRQKSGPDWLRPFRDLAKHPTGQRLAGILRRDREHRGHPYHTEAIRAAIAWLRLFDGDVPPDWFHRVADDPDAVRSIAAKVCACFRSGRRGPVPDHALQRYADQIATIYEDLTGKRIAYSKTRIDEHTAYGPGLEFMCAALRLLDPGLDEQSAVAQIDRIRGWGRRRKARRKGTSPTAGCDCSK